MELKHLVKQFTYRIEPKPEGGFIAHATDPSIPPLEAPTREQLQQKIQAKIADALATEFPGLKLPTAEGNERTFSFHIEHTPEGKFAIHSSDPNEAVIEGKTHDEIEGRLAEKLLGFVGKHFAPELSQALAAQGNPADIKVVVNRQTFTVKTHSGQASSGTAQDFQSATPLELNASDNAPIIPESSGAWSVLRFLLAALIVGMMLYLFLYRR
jgi:hypothetical protein